MRVVFHLIVGPGFVGGSIRSTVELADELQDHVEVHVVDPFGDNAGFAQEIRGAGLRYHSLLPDESIREIGPGSAWGRVYRLPSAWRQAARLARSAENLFDELRPDLVICNDFRSAYMLTMTRSLRRRAVALFARGWYVRGVPRYPLWLMRNRLAGIVAVSHQTRTALMVAGYGRTVRPPRNATDGIYVLHNAINVESILEMAAIAPNPALPAGTGQFKIVLPGNISVTKGQLVAIRALRRVVDAGVNADLYLAGGVWPGQDCYYKRIRARVEELGLRERVHWLGHRRDCLAVMGAADLVIVPSLSEGHPRVVLEAMGLGKPCVASAVGAVTEMMIPGLTGVYVEPGDEQGLADGIMRLGKDPRAAAIIGRQAQASIRSSFAPERRLEQAISMFQRMIGRSGA